MENQFNPYMLLNMFSQFGGNQQGEQNGEQEFTGSGPSLNTSDNQQGQDLSKILGTLGSLFGGGAAAGAAAGPAGLAASMVASEVGKGIASFKELKGIKDLDTSVDSNNIQQSLKTVGALDARGKEKFKYKLGPAGPLRMLLGRKAKKEAQRKEEELKRNIIEEQGIMNQDALRSDQYDQQGDVLNARLRQLDPYRIANGIR